MNVLFINKEFQNEINDKLHKWTHNENKNLFRRNEKEKKKNGSNEMGPLKKKKKNYRK